MCILQFFNGIHGVTVFRPSVVKASTKVLSEISLMETTSRSSFSGLKIILSKAFSLL